MQRNKEKSPSEVEHLKRTFARQRAKDIADHAKDVLEKDNEIEKLKKRCQELADQLSNNVMHIQVNYLNKASSVILVLII